MSPTEHSLEPVQRLDRNCSKLNLDETLRLADDLYRKRGEPGSVEQSLELLDGALASSRRGFYEVYWRRSRACFFLGQQAERRTQKAARHRAGVESGKRAAATDSASVEGHFWLGVNLALLAEASGGISGAIAMFRARRSLTRASEIRESYHGAGPLRVLGRLAHKAPRALGGSLSKAQRLYARALEIRSGNTVTLIYAAELALQLGKTEHAGRLLRTVLECGGVPDWEFEATRDKQIARVLLERLHQNRPYPSRGDSL
jgi:hypothetical protein